MTQQQLPEPGPSGLDAFGLGAVAKYLAGPIVQGVGRLLKPLVGRLDNSAQIANWNAWDEALKVRGYDPKTVDLTIGERAEIRMTADAIVRQSNRESIAIEAITHAKNIADDGALGRLALPDADWVDRFWRLAENVSHKDMQAFWGAVLARKSTGTVDFSARALDFLTTLSGDEARKLERVAKFAITIQVTPDFVDHAILTQLTNHTDRMSGESKTAFEAFNKRFIEYTGNIDSPLFGSLGVYIDNGWAHSIVQRPRDGKVSFSIAGKEFEANVPHGHVDEHGFYSIGGHTGISPLGRELFQMIAPVPDEGYFQLLKEGFELKGLKLRQVDVSGN